MRRSSAPSHIGCVHAPNTSTSINHVGNNRQEIISKCAPIENAARTTQCILGLIEKAKQAKDFAYDNIQEEPHSEVRDSPKTTSIVRDSVQNLQTEPCNNKKRIFNVVYGKPSKKKHKTWEGDGILEVGEKSLTLKDCEGSVLGRGSGKKNSELEEGSRLFVGSKEVEIIDAVTTAVEAVTAMVTLPAKKARLSTTRTLKKSQTSVLSPYSPLVMPQPDLEHQWKFNASGATVRSVVVDPGLVKVLRPHQREGMTFLFRCVTGLRDPQHLGAILADEMGLGKTLQCITLIWTMLRQGLYSSISLAKKVLVVTPSSLTHNWHQEFLRWLGKERICVFVVDQKHKTKDFQNHPNIPVMIISYEMFVRNYEDVAAVPFDLIICDEGHRLKNNSIRASTLLSQLPCKRRIILSGTPVQNDLQEFFTLVNFVNPDILGTYTEFRKNYEDAIVQSQQQNAPAEIKAFGQAKAQELSCHTAGFVLRRTQTILDKYLPSKCEAVLFCRPTDLQLELFEAAIKYWEEGEDVSHLAVIIALKKICNHPSLLQDRDSEKENVMVQDKLYNFLSKELSRLGGDRVIIEYSSKLTVVKSLLHSSSCTGEKVVLVSYFTKTLDLLSALCDQDGYSHCRLDGNTQASHRVDLVNQFNSTCSPYSVFLLSARAGGMGLNLTGASRLIMFDSDWNPASDLQAMARVWRDGQRRQVYIYRLMTTGSIEEKIFQRQLSKAGLNEAVVDQSHTSSVRLSNEELKDLFSVSKDSDCLTHAALPCDCQGVGDIPQPVVPQADSRQCQLMAHQGQGHILRMNQLFQWEHYKQPVPQKLLQTIGLEDVADVITFIFRHVLDHTLPTPSPCP